ncbi:MAG: hypothetical protein JNK82_21830 [Myxococcaceae bacterium]|nr:hypothetical protein [Myxococcaceae bacterium]
MANKKLKVCTTIVPPSMKEVTRLFAGVELIASRPGGCDLIVLPGMFLGDQPAALFAAARRAGVAVLAGVGEGVLGWAPGSAKVREFHSGVNEMRVGSHRIAPIIGREIFVPEVCEGVAKLKPRVAVLVAVSAGGARHWAGQQKLARMGVASVRSVHANEGARDFLYRPTGEEPPSRVSQLSGITVSCFTV